MTYDRRMRNVRKRLVQIENSALHMTDGKPNAMDDRYRLPDTICVIAKSEVKMNKVLLCLC